MRETRSHQASRWAGAWSDVIRVVIEGQRAMAEIGSADPEVEIEVASLGRESAYGSLEELRERVAPADVPQLRSVRAEIRGPVASPTVVARWGANDTALSVTGSDAVMVEGVFGAIAPVFRRGTQPITHAQVTFLALAVGGAAAAVAIFLAQTVLTGTIALVLVGAIVVFPAILATEWLLPDFEWLPDGGRPRLHRFRVWLISGVGVTVAIAISANLLTPR